MEETKPKKVIRKKEDPTKLQSLKTEDITCITKGCRDYIAKSFVKLLNKAKENIKNKKYWEFFECYVKGDITKLTWESLGHHMITYSAFYAYVNLKPEDIEKILNDKGRGYKDLMLIKEIINAYLDHRALKFPQSAQYIIHLKQNDQPERFLSGAKTKAISNALEKKEQVKDNKSNNSAIQVDLSGIKS